MGTGLRGPGAEPGGPWPRRWSRTGPARRLSRVSSQPPEGAMPPALPRGARPGSAPPPSLSAPSGPSRCSRGTGQAQGRAHGAGARGGGGEVTSPRRS